MDLEVFKLSTEAAISTSLLHNTAFVGKCEQEHTSVLNYIFQHENVYGVGNLSNSSTGFEVFVGEHHNSNNKFSPP